MHGFYYFQKSRFTYSKKPFQVLSKMKYYHQILTSVMIVVSLTCSSIAGTLVVRYHNHDLERPKSNIASDWENNKIVTRYRKVGISF